MSRLRATRLSLAGLLLCSYAAGAQIIGTPNAFEPRLRTGDDGATYMQNPTFTVKGDITGDNRDEIIEAWNTSKMTLDESGGSSTTIWLPQEQLSGVWITYSEEILLPSGETIPAGEKVGPLPQGMFRRFEWDMNDPDVLVAKMLVDGQEVDFPLLPPGEGLGETAPLPPIDPAETGITDDGSIVRISPNLHGYYYGEFTVNFGAEFRADPTSTVQIRLFNPDTGALDHIINSTMADWNCAAHCVLESTWCATRPGDDPPYNSIYYYEVHGVADGTLRSTGQDVWWSVYLNCL